MATASKLGVIVVIVERRHDRVKPASPNALSLRHIRPSVAPIVGEGKRYFPWVLPRPEVDYTIERFGERGPHNDRRRRTDLRERRGSACVMLRRAIPLQKNMAESTPTPRSRRRAARQNEQVNPPAKRFLSLPK